MNRALKFYGALVLGLLVTISWSSPAAAEQVDLGLITVKQKTLAESLRSQLASGANFEALAKKHSVGPAAARGGRLGKVPNSRLRSEYRRALAGLKPNRPSRVIPTEEGYTILMRFDRPDPKKPPITISSTGTAKPARPEPAGPRPPATGTPLQVARAELMAGLEFIATGDIKNTAVHVKRALKANPRDDNALFLQEVLKLHAEGKAGKRALIYFGKGLVAITDADVKKAEENFRHARTAEPRFWPATLMQARLMAGRGRLKEAGSLLDQVLQVNPSSKRAYLAKGRLAMDAGQLKQAREFFSKALQIDPNQAEVHYNLAALALTEGKRDVAEMQLKAALKLDPYMEEAYTDLGLIYGASNRLDEAAKAFRKALEINPQFAAAHVNLGIIYIRKKQVVAAIEEFQKAVNINPQLAEAHANLAAAYTVRKQWRQAIEHADIAVKLGFPMPKVVLQRLAPHRR